MRGSELMARTLLAGLCLTVATGVSYAQTAQQPVLRAGDQWQFVQYWAVPSTEPNRHWKIVSVSRDLIEGTENGEPLRMTPNLGVIESPRELNTNPQFLSFPLEVGKRWTYSTDWLYKSKGSKGRMDAEVRVAGYEKVRVPAGEFDAFRLEARNVFKGRSGIGSIIDAESQISYWYAPAARAIVKSVNRNPYLGTSTVELVKYDPQR
jgi:hypothetical protein